MQQEDLEDEDTVSDELEPVIEENNKFATRLVDFAENFSSILPLFEKIQVFTRRFNVVIFGILIAASWFCF